MKAPKIPALVDCGWLVETLGDTGLVVLDASFFLPNQGRSARDEYGQGHIPGALFFDIDEVADRGNDLPHMLPSSEQFDATLGAMGIAEDTCVVVYDSNYFMASARVWWTFRVFGHDRVSVLDGGLERWRALDYPVTSDESINKAVTPARSSLRRELVCDLARMSSLSENETMQIVDARSPGRFAGTEPESRAGLRSGHIPGSRNVFFKTLVDEGSRCLKSPEAIETAFASAGVDPGRPIVTTCGTGVTAAILALGLYVVAQEDAAVYDGSWTEWGGCEDTPIATGSDA